MKGRYVALYLILIGIVFSIHGYYIGIGAKLFSVGHVIILGVALIGYYFTYNYIKMELMNDVS